MRQERAVESSCDPLNPGRLGERWATRPCQSPGAGKGSQCGAGTAPQPSGRGPAFPDLPACKAWGHADGNGESGGQSPGYAFSAVALSCLHDGGTKGGRSFPIDGASARDARGGHRGGAGDGLGLSGHRVRGGPALAAGGLLVAHRLGVDVPGGRGRNDGASAAHVGVASRGSLPGGFLPPPPPIAWSCAVPT